MGRGSHTARPHLVYSQSRSTTACNSVAPSGVSLLEGGSSALTFGRSSHQTMYVPARRPATLQLPGTYRAQIYSITKRGSCPSQSCERGGVVSGS